MHTPQDVFVALVTGFALMLLAGYIEKMLEAHPERDIIVAAIGMGVSLACMVYVTIKPYPMDYDSAGKLLVDPMKMANDSYKNVGWALGFFVGWVLERRFVRFSVDGTVQQRFARAACGLPIALLVNYTISDMIKAVVPGGIGSVVACFVQIFFVVFIMPAIFKRFERHTQSNA